MDITQEYLKECLDYNPDTGVFTWKVRPKYHFTKTKKNSCNAWNSRLANKVTGSPSTEGYLVIGINSKLYQSHRLAFLYMTGSFPKDQIDHINHTKNDNRWCNLRGVTGQENQRNLSLSRVNTSGFTGVHFCNKTEKWISVITSGQRIFNLGSYSDISDAIKARKAANIEYGFHENHGSKL